MNVRCVRNIVVAPRVSFPIQEKGRLGVPSSSRQPSVSTPNRINAAPPSRPSTLLATTLTLKHCRPSRPLLLWPALFHARERNTANARHRLSPLPVPMSLVVIVTKTDNVTGVVNAVLFLRWVSSILFKLRNAHQERWRRCRGPFQTSSPPMANGAGRGVVNVSTSFFDPHSSPQLQPQNRFGVRHVATRAQSPSSSLHHHRAAAISAPSRHPWPPSRMEQVLARPPPFLS
ncbi:hypothetical protein V8G54_032771 [Vigna mungo]|uniref:Uncharacterized protein n=1 Tax=Vigna mungo TaxID=3915 RepID=A0AAQ3MMS9_VIGMU